MSAVHTLDETAAEFVAESREGLDQLERDLVELEARPDDVELLKRIFRCMHSLKGSAGFLGLAYLEELTHAGENLLSLLRDGELAVDGEITSALLGVLDATRGIFDTFVAQGDEGSPDLAALVRRLHQLAKPQPGGPAIEVEVAEAEPSDAEPAAAPEPAEAQVAAAPGAAPALRIDVALIDRLMDLAGELVLARNQLLALQAGREDAPLAAASQRINMITAGLQAGIMHLRMQPIDGLLSKFPRIVRDLARGCGKQVRLDVDGRQTELDRSLIEAIKDPLTHLLRNAIDHGVERPEVRVAGGKPAEGRVAIHAFHQAGQVHIAIADDGAGIPLEKVRQKAIDRGLVTAERAAQLGPAELANLIFLPGLSTASAVTTVSGRGVGMDVVKSNVERIGGTVEIETRAGAGTRLLLKLPLTLAIVPALIVASRGHRFAVPQASVLELVRLDERPGARGIELVHGAQVYRLRDRLLPVVALAGVLGSDGAGAPAADAAAASGSRFLVVMQVSGRLFGLGVDAIIDQQEIVVKPLSRRVRRGQLFAGATILGDGAVAMILDVLGVAQASGVLSDVADAVQVTGADAGVGAGERRRLLLVEGPGGARMAVPLDDVARLETFRASTLERVGGSDVVQYRGEILPLVRLGAAEGEAQAEQLRGVVLRSGGRRYGLIVDKILDVVEVEGEVLATGRRDGVLGTLVVDRRVTELLDMQRLAQASEAA